MHTTHTRNIHHIHYKYAGYTKVNNLCCQEKATPQARCVGYYDSCIRAVFIGIVAKYFKTNFFVEGFRVKAVCARKIKVSNVYFLACLFILYKGIAAMLFDCYTWVITRLLV